jgi:hypothetical protein
VRYYQFLKRYDELYRGNRSHSEAVLVYPRKTVHEGDVAAVAKFKEVGKDLLNRHVLFDVLPDDLPHDPLEPRKLGPPVSPRLLVRPTAESPLAVLPKDRSIFTAPQTVRVSASRPAKGARDEITLHFVNYNRHEPAEPKSAGSGIVDEKPIAARGVAADLLLPPATRAVKVLAISPEWPEPVECKIVNGGGRVKFEMPEFLVYGVARVMLAEQKP